MHAVIASLPDESGHYELAKHRAGNNCPVFPAIITTERDGYFEVATVISRTMLRLQFPLLVKETVGNNFARKNDVV